MIKARKVLTGVVKGRNKLIGKVNLQTKKITPTTQEKSVMPTTSIQEVIADEGIFALSKVTVEAVTSEIDNNIQSENIKNGVSILGVTGTLEEGYKISVEENTLIFNSGVSVEEGELVI